MNKKYSFSIDRNHVNYYNLQEIAGRNKISIEDAVLLSWNGWNKIQKVAAEHGIYTKINGKEVPLNLTDWDRV